MKLGIGERLELMELLPREGTYAALKALRVARECLSLTPEEINEFCYLETPAPSGHGVTITWDVNREREVDIPLDQYATDTIVNLLSKLDKDNKLTDRTCSLYERFVVNASHSKK